MSEIAEAYKNLIVEFHILQSFPVSCLNRDDVGAPKTAIVGGSSRARVSSQCWKRQVRLQLQKLGAKTGTRTKLLKGLVAEACRRIGATSEQADHCGAKIEQIFMKEKEAREQTDANNEENEEAEQKREKTDTLLFLSESDTMKIAQAFKDAKFKPEKVITQKVGKKQAEEFAKLVGRKPNEAIDALDIALFGRMVAQAPFLNVEAAASFAHAISTHKVSNEVEFFTALDDCQKEQGSAHMGSLEFNSATYYRYVSLDLGQYWKNLAGQEIELALERFMKALYLAIPSARQTTQSGACPWEYARVLVRRGQRVQASFETAVKSENGGFLEPSKIYLRAWLDKQERLNGSLFGIIGNFDYGEDPQFSIDELIKGVKEAVKKAVA